MASSDFNIPLLHERAERAEAERDALVAAIGRLYGSREVRLDYNGMCGFPARLVRRPGGGVEVWPEKASKPLATIHEND